MVFIPFNAKILVRAASASRSLAEWEWLARCRKFTALVVGHGEAWGMGKTLDRDPS